MNPDRLPLLMFAFVGLVIVAVIGMSSGSWVWFFMALAVHLIASFFVFRHAIGSAQTGGEADKKSERLNRIAGDAVGKEQPGVNEELEALKHQPAQRT